MVYHQMDEDPEVGKLIKHYYVLYLEESNQINEKGVS